MTEQRSIIDVTAMPELDALQAEARDLIYIVDNIGRLIGGVLPRIQALNGRARALADLAADQVRNLLDLPGMPAEKLPIEVIDGFGTLVWTLTGAADIDDLLDRIAAATSENGRCDEETWERLK